MKIIRNVRHGLPTADNVNMLPSGLNPRALRGEPPAKKLALGRVWRSDLRPLFDAHLDALEPLLTSYGPNPRVIDLGKTWTGGLTAELESAGRAAESSPAGDVVDTTEVLKETAGLNAQLISGSPSAVRILDALRKVRNAVGRAGGRTTDAGALKRFTELSPQQRMSGPNSPENVEARKFWDRQNAPVTPGRPIGDSTTTGAVRDGLHAVNQARSTPELNARANQLARDFWARPN